MHRIKPGDRMRRRDFVASIVAVWPLATLAQEKPRDEPCIPQSWLQEKTTVAEAEAANPGIMDDRVTRFPEAAKPFGFQNQEWEKFKALIAPGDELRKFSSPAESWEHLAGRAGVALVRDGVPIKIIVTLMN
jgi:hypothetical protein